MKYIYLILIIIVINLQISFSNEDFEYKIKSNLPQILNKNAVGTYFALGFHPCWEDTNSVPTSGNALKIYVYAMYETNIKITIPYFDSNPWMEKTARPNDIIEFILPPDIGLPYRRGKNALASGLQPTKLFNGKGILLESDMPVVVYGFARFFNTSDGFLALPIHQLGKEYIVSAYRETTYFTFQSLTPYVSIIAPYDNTNVSFFIGGNMDTRIKTTDGKALRPFEIMQMKLNKGDYWLIASEGPFSDLGGSMIVADKPISVLSGNHCAQVPFDVPACDYIIEQEISTEFWGKKYYVPPIYSRKKSPILRLFAKEPLTRFLRNGYELWESRSNWGIENEDWIEIRSNPDTNAPAVIQGLKPINVVMYNTGQWDDNVPGDPFQMQLSASEQFQNELIFFTPGINASLGFEQNYLSVLFESNNQGDIPDDLEIGMMDQNGKISKWEKFKDLYLVSMNKFPDWDLEKTNRKMYVATAKILNQSAYKIRCSSSKIAAYAYGFSEYDSYGLPANLTLRDLTKKDTIAPKISYKMRCDGTLVNPINLAETLIVEDLPLGSSSGLSYIFYDKSLSYNYDFGYEDFIPGAAKSTKWWLKIKNPNKDARAVITFADRAGNDTTIIVNYRAINLSINPDKHFFGNLMLGESKTKTFTLKNESTTNPFYMKELKLQTVKQQLASRGFTLEYNFNPDTILKPKELVYFNVTFKATQKGEFKDSIGVGDTCFFNYLAFVWASVEMPFVYISDIDFKQGVIGKKYTATATIKNFGQSPVQITGVKKNKLVAFSFDDFLYSPQNPLVLNSGDEYNFEVYFVPNAEKKYIDTIEFIFDKLPDDDPYCILTGEGVRPTLETYDINWFNKRAHLERYNNLPFMNMQPYPAPNGGIRLINSGGRPINISYINILEEINADAFEIMVDDKYYPIKEYVKSIEQIKDINGKSITTIPPDQEVIIPVYFHPKTSGDHKLTLEFVCDAVSNPIVNLSGRGVYGILENDTINFELKVVKSQPTSQKLTLTNLNWEFQDSVVIYDFVSDPPNAINFDKNFMGTEGFAIDKQAIKFPIILRPGEKYEIDVFFSPAKQGFCQARLKTISDAFEEGIYTLNGYGANQLLETRQRANKLLCSDIITEDIFVDVINHSFQRIEILPNTIKFTNYPDNFALKQILDKNGNILPINSQIPINPNDSILIVIEYKPILPNQKSNQIEKITEILEFETDSNEPNLKTIKTELNFDQIHYLLEISGLVNNQQEFEVKPKESMLDEKITYSLKLFIPESLTQFNLNDIEIEISYPRNFVTASFDNNGKLKLINGKDMPKDWQLDTKYPTYFYDENNNLEKVKIKFTGTTALFAKGEYHLFDLELIPFFPYYVDKDNQLKIKENTIFISANAQNQTCIEFQEQSKPKLHISEICANNLRNIIIGANDFNLNNVYPNPSNSISYVSFEIPFEMFVAINLFDANGKLVDKILDTKLKHGKYELKIDSEKYPNGIYFLEMKSCEFVKRVKFVIN